MQWDVMVRRSSLKASVRTASNKETSQGEKQKRNPISRPRGRNGRVQNVQREDIVTAYAISRGGRRNANGR